MNKQELIQIMTRLVELGEDQKELAYWLSIFDDLPEDKQKEIFLNFQEELKKLSIPS